MPLMSNMLLTLTLARVTAMVMTMVVITAMARATVVGTMIIPMVAMTVVMSMMLAMSSVFLYRWGTVCVRLCCCFLFALLWDLNALWRN